MFIIIIIIIKESNNVRFSALHCVVFELSAFENSVEFPAESGCKANSLTRYKVDTACPFYLIFNRSTFHAAVFIIEMHHSCRVTCIPIKLEGDLLTLDVAF